MSDETRLAIPLALWEAYEPFPSNQRRYYERSDRFPDGLLVPGDAIASHDPIYGHGMSPAAPHALVFHHTLTEHGPGDLAPALFDKAEPTVDSAWLMAVGTDFQFALLPVPSPEALLSWGGTCRDLPEKHILTRS